MCFGSLDLGCSDIDFLGMTFLAWKKECHAKNRHNLSERTFFSSKFPLSHMESINALFKILECIAHTLLFSLYLSLTLSQVIYLMPELIFLVKCVKRFSTSSLKEINFRYKWECVSCKILCSN